MNKASDLHSPADSILGPAVSVRSLVNPAMVHRPDANLRCVAEGAEVEWPCYPYRLGVLERHGVDPFGRNEVMLAHRPDIDWMCAKERDEEDTAVEWPCTSYRTEATEQYGLVHLV